MRIAFILLVGLVGCSAADPGPPFSLVDSWACAQNEPGYVATTYLSFHEDQTCRFAKATEVPFKSWQCMPCVWSLTHGALTITIDYGPGVPKTTRTTAFAVIDANTWTHDGLTFVRQNVPVVDGRVCR